MNKELLISLGLTIDEATIYNVLLEGGFMPARTVALRSSIGRPLTYKILDDLIIKGVVEKKELGKKVSLFSPVHPRELEKLLEKKKEEIDNTKKALDESIGQMISKYNLFIGKPNVQFYEGEEAVNKITRDYPETDKEIRQWINISEAMKIMGNDTVRYLNERIKNGISKRMIIPESEENRNYAKSGSELTSFKITKKELPTVIQVYDNKVAMLTLSKEKNIGLLIEDKDIAATLKNIFDDNWEKSEEIN
jgi:sugar-specific transcriptional regulator TrmB